MIFKMFNCDLVVTHNDVDYTFTDFDSVTIEDPETNRLMRGSNGQNKLGMIYTEGSKDAKKMTANALNLDADMFTLMEGIFKDKSRVTVSVIDRTNGSSKVGKNCILCQYPQQKTIDESPDSMIVELMFETFDLKETHKA